MSDDWIVPGGRRATFFDAEGNESPAGEWHVCDDCGHLIPVGTDTCETRETDPAKSD